MSSGLPPLLAAHITSEGRLISICSESYGWWTKTNSAPHSRQDAYSCVTKAIRDIAAGKAGVFAISESLKKQEFVGVYDSVGNLQAVATFTYSETKHTAKVHKLATAIWNLSKDESEAKPCKGAGTAAMLKVMDIVRERAGPAAGFVFTEPAVDAKAFYEKCLFKVVAGWAPKELGSCCGMAVQVTAAATDALRGRISGYGQELVLCKEAELLRPTRLHYRIVFWSAYQEALHRAA